MNYSEMERMLKYQFKDCIKYPDDVREREGEGEKERRVAFTLPPVCVMTSVLQLTLLKAQQSMGKEKINK